MKRANQSRSGYGDERLTEREREILTDIIDGRSNREIAQRLHLALQTIKWYTSHIYNKLGIESRPQLAIWLMDHGLLRRAPEGK